MLCQTARRSVVYGMVLLPGSIPYSEKDGRNEIIEISSDESEHEVVIVKPSHPARFKLYPDYSSTWTDVHVEQPQNNFTAKVQTPESASRDRQLKLRGLRLGGTDLQQ
jgi:hypothetical protein